MRKVARLAATIDDALVDEHYERVRCYVSMRVPARDCEDVVADVFLRAVERGGERRSLDALPWLMSIARSRVADYYRRRDGRVVSMGDLSRGESDVSGNVIAAQSQTDSALAPLERLQRVEFAELFRKKMLALTDAERDVIAFKFTEGLANAEIAELVGVTPNNLGVLLHRALGKLRALMLEEATDVA